MGKTLLTSADNPPSVSLPELKSHLWNCAEILRGSDLLDPKEGQSITPARGGSWILHE
jgi:hypothetical protein